MSRSAIMQLGLQAALGRSAETWTSWVETVRARPSRHRELFQDKAWDDTGERAAAYWKSLRLIADANADTRNTLNLRSAPVDPMRLLYFDPRRMTYDDLLSDEFGVFDHDDVPHPEFIIHVDPPDNPRACDVSEPRGWVLCFIPEELGVDMDEVIQSCPFGWLWRHGEGPGRLAGI